MAAGVRWSAVDVISQQVLRFAITVVLTRLVAPGDYGLLGIALVFVQLASLIGDLGLGPALVQRTNIDRSHMVTAFTVTVIAGLALTVLVTALSWPVASFFGEPRLQGVLSVMSVTYLLRGIAGAPRELLRREMRFGGFAAVSVISISSGGVFGIVLALRGAGVWALVVSVVVENAVAVVTALVIALRANVWSFGLGIDRKALSDIGSFGAYVSGSRVAYFAASNIDNVIVGKVLGAQALGLYNLAYRLMLYPVLRVSDVLANVTMPALATAQHDLERVRRAYGRACQAVSLVCFPVSIGIAVTAPALVPTVFGSKWIPAVTTVQILSINGLRLAVSRLSGTVYEALGRPARDFALLTVTLIVYAVAFFLGVHWGIEGMAWAYTIAGFALVPLDQAILSNLLKCRPFVALPTLIPVAGATVVLGLAGVSAMSLSKASPDLMRVLMAAAAMAVAYVAALRLLAPGLMRSTARSLSTTDSSR